MGIFNKMMPWFIPTKSDQKGWYLDELKETPKETQRLLSEFMDVSKEYDARLGSFESKMVDNYEQYNEYLQLKSMAQQISFLWGRIEYKKDREQDLQRILRDL